VLVGSSARARAAVHWDSRALPLRIRVRHSTRTAVSYYNKSGRLLVAALLSTTEASVVCLAPIGCMVTTSLPSIMSDSLDLRPPFDGQPRPNITPPRRHLIRSNVHYCGVTIQH
jgi:hypothetical protein